MLRNGALCSSCAFQGWAPPCKARAVQSTGASVRSPPPEGLGFAHTMPIKGLCRALVVGWALTGPGKVQAVHGGHSPFAPVAAELLAIAPGPETLGLPGARCFRADSIA